MKKVWPTVPLGEVLTQVERPEAPLPGTLYRQLGVKLWGQGAYERESIDGGATKYATLSSVEVDDIVVNKIWARNGSVAVVQKQLAGCFVSGEFPTFTPKADSLSPRWMHWLTKTPGFWGQCDHKSQGSSGKNRIKPEQFLKVEIPLPLLAEQQRIVARIEGLAAKIAEARSLRRRAIEEAEALSRSARRYALGASAQSDWIPLSRYVAEIENGKSPATEGRPAAPDEWAVLKVGAVSFGFFDEHENKALPTSFAPIPRLEVKPGDFIMSRANTAELVGACAVVRKTRSKLMLSDKIFRFIFREPQQVELSYLDQVLKSSAIREQIVAAASGTSPTMKNISKEKVLSLRLPPHALPEQRRIVSYLDAMQAKVDALKSLQAETAAELAALLPSILDKAFKGEM